MDVRDYNFYAVNSRNTKISGQANGQGQMNSRMLSGAVLEGSNG